VISGGLAIWAAAIAWKDWRSHRVPNAALVLVLVPAVLALLMNGKGLLGVGVLPSLLGFLVGGGILLPGYAMGKMGAGDIKFAACMGLLLGPQMTVKALLIFAIVLGALSGAIWIYHQHVPGVGQRRIAAAPALAAGFIVQLFANTLFWGFF
jgi:prepilin peptidase CpaA